MPGYRSRTFIPYIENNSCYGNDRSTGISFLLQLVNEPASCSDGSLQGAHCKGFPAPSTGMAPQGKISSELGCVPAAGPCRDPPPPMDKSPGTCPRMSPAAGSPVLGGGSPHCHQQTQVVPFPGKELLASALGSSSRGRFWGLCPWGLSPASAPHGPCPLRPPVCAQPSGEAALFSHRPQFGQAGPQHPQASCCSRGARGQPGQRDAELTESTEDLGDF